MPVLGIVALLVLTPLGSLPICFYITGAIVWKVVVKTPILTVARLRNSTTYSPSDLGPQQIRLLDIHPGSHDDKICCKLCPANLDEAKYDALSYTWGNGYRQHEVEVDGCTFYVGENLYAALRHLRHSKNTRVMWIDAICINQADMEERKSQVNMMRRIYQQASTVVIWLGSPLDSYLDLGTRYVSRIAQAEKAEVNRIWQESSKWQKSVDKMLRDTWWDRAWVVQEAFLAKHAVVQCGKHVIPFDDLCNFITHPATIGRLSGLKSFPVFNLATTVQGVHNSVGDPQYGMLALAHQFRQRLATDSRDKIYAFMGLLNDDNNHLIQVDYTKSDETVFQDFAKASISRYRNLLPVALATESSTQASWCPSWAASMGPFEQFWPDRFKFPGWEDTNPFWRGGLDDVRWYPLQVPGRYLAAGGHPAMCRTDLPDPAMLAVKGFTYDIVVATSSDPVLQIFATWRTLLESWEALAFQYSPASEAEKSVAFTRTITANIPDSPIPNWRNWTPATRRRWMWRKATPREPKEHTIQDIMKAACGSRRFFVTANGTFGLGPSTTRAGDPVCVLLGSDVPFVLEAVKRKEGEIVILHKVRGQAYVDGAMVYEGDIKGDIEDGKIKLEEFFLI